MQIGGAAPATQINAYAQTQAREANPAAAAQVNRPQVTQTQTDQAVSATSNAVKASDRKPSLDEQLVQAQRDAANGAGNDNQNVQAQGNQANAQGARRGSLVDITA